MRTFRPGLLSLAALGALTVTSVYACSAFDAEEDPAPPGSEARDDARAPDEDGAVAEDGTAPEGGKRDAGPSCDPGRPFGAPRRLIGEALNTPATERAPRLSSDETTLYFHREEGGSSRLYRAAQSGLPGTFTRPELVPIDGMTSGVLRDHDPSLAADGLTLYFASYREGSDNMNLWRATRPSTGLNFRSPERLSISDATLFDGEPFVTNGDDELFFVKSLDPLTIMASRRDANGNLTNPTTVEGVKVPGANNTHPVLSFDGLTMYFAREYVAAAPNYEIWMATRGTKKEEFTVVRKLDELNDTDIDAPGFISQDQCRIYFERQSAADGGNDFDLWMAERAP